MAPVHERVREIAHRRNSASTSESSQGGRRDVREGRKSEAEAAGGSSAWCTVCLALAGGRSGDVGSGDGGGDGGGLSGDLEMKFVSGLLF